jgi:alpha-D-xyloside xylohydrolase
MNRLAPVLALGAALAAPLLPVAAATGGASDGLLLSVGGGHLKVAFCADDVVRVAFARDASFFDRPSLAAGVRRCEAVRVERTDAGGQATLATPKMRVRVDLGTGRVAFLDARGGPILVEREGARSLVPAEVQGERTFQARQEWAENEGEALYGLGQQQLGLLDVKGYDLDLWQRNATVIVPFLVSSRGYGVLWDNASYTRFGDLRPWEPVPPARLVDATGKPGGLTGSYHAGAGFERLVATRVDPAIAIAVPSATKQPNLRIHPSLPPEGEISVRWEGALEAAETGDHLLQLYSNGGIRMWVDGRLVADHWRQGWLPWIDLARVPLEKGRRHRLKIEWSKDQGMERVRLLWKTPPKERSTSLWSEVADGLDYWFVYGPGLDRVTAGYRRLTGEAPMMPRWAFGLWQSRQRYETQQQSLDVVDGFRSRRIPFDTIVQDWFYWPENAWGSHRFDPARFPDPDGWVRAIHERNARLMISVWGKFYPGSENFEAMRAKGFLYETTLRSGFKDWVGPGYPYAFFDAFNPEARNLFWAQVERDLFRRGMDAWWMDATEPDLLPTPDLDAQRAHMHPTAMGSGSRVLNAYPLLNSQGVYEGQRKAAPDQRVFILTRSAFAGQQRYAAATWSGDITSTWTALRQQIAGGLSFSLSGIPYWTVDIGGFSVPGRFSRKDPKPEDAEEWRELNTRWFQYGTFLPLTRVHGEAPKREMWEMGGESHPAYQAHLKFDRLRYRMLPYVYSLAGAVTHESGTFLRPLVMDFPNDPASRRVADQYLFGPAFLVSPVTEHEARRRNVVLPLGASWYDFWTGAMIAGGQATDAPAPYDAMPVHVRAGSVVPFGPELQWTGEKPADPLTLFVYAGADGAFTLYEDDGLTYGYEKGAFSRIPLRWNDAAGTLTIGKREGTFPGMLAQRTFEVVRVGKAKPVGFSFEPKPDRAVPYNGAEVVVRLE